LVRARELLVRGVWRALVVGPTRQVLARSSSSSAGATAAPARDDTERLLEAAWERYRALASDLPSEPSASGRVSVVAAAMLLALMEAFVDEGMERAGAARLVGEISWVAYRQTMGRVGPPLLAKLSPDPSRRVRLAMDIGLRYEFTEPSYHHRRVPVADGDGFDMLRCPIADYLKARDAADLCATAFCALDYRIFELVGMRLERSGTLGGGAPLCDFRAFPLSTGGTPAIK
jgi:ubiquinone biosynthesis protein